jgi:hypothetical protein
MEEHVMSNRPHIADAEAGFKVVNVAPDFCDVEGTTVPFEIHRDLPHEKTAYAQTVFARGEKVLCVESVIQGVVGNAGKGVVSGVALASGNVEMTHGAQTVNAEGRAVCRHEDLCLMNVG